MELLFLASLNLFAGITLSGACLTEESLYFDTLRSFGYFRDHFHALNYCGEIGWWNPNIDIGFPVMYYGSILVSPFTTPLLMILGAVCWILGLFGIYFSSFQPLYTIYLSFLVPWLFSLGLLLLARQIFKNPRVILFIVLTASFSPSVVWSLSDAFAFDLTAYGIFFAAASLKFLQRPSKSSFLALSLAGAILAVGFNMTFLWWNFIFLPLLVIVVGLINNVSIVAQIKKITAVVPGWYFGFFACLILACAFPTVLTFIQEGDIYRAGQLQRAFSFNWLSSGNPLEALLGGVPGIGVNWTPHVANSMRPFPHNMIPGYYLSYVYLGMLTLPLAFYGLICGRRVWRARLLILIMIPAVIISMVGYSPIFACLLVWPTPLRLIRHYSDGLFRSGTAFLWILSAGLGVEMVLRAKRKLRAVLLAIFLVMSTCSMVLFAILYGESSLSNPIFGFALMMIFLYTIALMWFVMAKKDKLKAQVFTFLLLLTLVDISTVAFWHVRNMIVPVMTRVNEPPVDNIGLGDRTGNWNAKYLLELGSLRSLKEVGVDIASMPLLSLFDAAKIGGARSIKEMQNRPEGLTALVLPQECKEEGSFQMFFDGANTAGVPEGNIRVQKQTYNTLSLEVTAPRESLLFWRDAYSPYWRATVNGRESKIVKAFLAFKAVTVPAGKSEVCFSFSPGLVPISLLTSYTIIVILCVLWWIAVRREKRELHEFRKIC